MFRHWSCFPQAAAAALLCCFVLGFYVLGFSRRKGNRGILNLQSMGVTFVIYLNLE